MDIDPRTCTEEEARDAFYEMSRRFGWVGTFYCRADVKVVDGDSDEIDFDKSITDAEWEVLRDSREWESIVDQMTYDVEAPSVVRWEDGTFGLAYPYSTVGTVYDTAGRMVADQSDT